MAWYLIWDAGGTLFNTYPAAASALQQALHELGYEASHQELTSLLRHTTAYALQHVAGRFALDEGELRVRFAEAYALMDPMEQPPFPGAVDVCRWVCDHGGANFIVTHRSRNLLEPLLKAHHLEELFVDWITGDDPYPRKPDPAALLAIAIRHRLPLARCMVIGDRELDVIAARRAGMAACLFQGNRPQGEDDAEQIADLTISHYHELLRWLEEHTRTEFGVFNRS